jgi:hypothetical protein
VWPIARCAPTEKKITNEVAIERRHRLIVTDISPVSPASAPIDESRLPANTGGLQRDRGLDAMTSEHTSMADDFAIRFKLRDIDKIEPWGQPGQRQLHWFALTDGVYCIDTPAGRLLEHACESDPDLGEPWCDYNVVRLCEDLCELWPSVREPVPIDIADRYFAWHAREGHRIDETNDDALYDLWYEASSWWHERQLDFGYLGLAPKVHLWRTGSEAHLDWTALAPWLLPEAKLSFLFETVHDAVVRFVQALLADMAARVTAIQTSNWQPRDGVLDIQGLVAEQAQREAKARSALAHVRHTDWGRIRHQLAQLGA